MPIQHRNRVKEMDDFKLQPTSLVNQIEKWLTDAILNGTIKEGDRLVETKLQSQFGVSRSPIREAFRDLANKGLVVIVPRKGTYVKKITRNDIEEQFPVRAVLEGLAAKLAFKRMTNGSIGDIEKIFGIMKKAAVRKDIKGYWKYHHLFHDELISQSKNNLLIVTLEQIRLQSLIYKVASLYYKEDLKWSLDVHSKMIALIKQKADPNKFGELVMKHIEEARPRFLHYIDEDDE